MPDALQLSFQLLSCRVLIEYEHAALEEKLAYLVLSARQELPVKKTLHYRVSGTGPYQVFEEGDFAEGASTPADVLHIVYRRVYLRVNERFTASGWVGYHGGLADIHGCRIGLLGDKGAGKSTLSSNLAIAGHAVQGDEMFMVRGKQALAMPRRFHLKQATERHVAGLPDLWDQLPQQGNGDQVIRALDPVSLDYHWQISAAAVDKLVWIEPNHGGETGLSALSSFEILQYLLNSVRQWSGDRNQAQSQSIALSVHGGYRLVYGEPQKAVKLLTELATSGA